MLDAYEKHRELVGKLLSTTAIGVIECDGQYTITKVNYGICAMLGYSEEELVGKSIDQITHPDDLDISHRSFNQLRDHPADSYAIEKQYLHKDGSSVPVALNVQAGDRDDLGHAKLFVGFIIDLSRLKNVESALQDVGTQLRETYQDTVSALARAIEARDPYTAGHQGNVAGFSVRIAQKLELDQEQQFGLALAAQVHDIGKIGVPVDFLTKPTKLTDHEYAIIQSHSESGFKILQSIEAPWPIAGIVYQHHERLDGSGYPQGLKNGEICLEAQIIAVSDTIDSMMNPRPYRRELGREKTISALQAQRKTKLDADIIDVAIELLN